MTPFDAPLISLSSVVVKLQIILVMLVSLASTFVCLSLLQCLSVMSHFKLFMLMSGPHPWLVCLVFSIILFLLMTILTMSGPFHYVLNQMFYPVCCHSMPMSALNFRFLSLLFSQTTVESSIIRPLGNILLHTGLQCACLAHILLLKMARPSGSFAQ